MTPTKLKFGAPSAAADVYTRSVAAAITALNTVAFIGPIVTIMGAIAGATVGTGDLFDLGIYGKEKDAALEKGLSGQDAHDYALGQAVVEGGIEAATVIPEFAIFAFTGNPVAAGAGSQVLKQTVIHGSQSAKILYYY